MIRRRKEEFLVKARLEERQYKALLRLSAEHKVSMAEYIRYGVDLALNRLRRARHA